VKRNKSKDQHATRRGIIEGSGNITPQHTWKSTKEQYTIRKGIYQHLGNAIIPDDQKKNPPPANYYPKLTSESSASPPFNNFAFALPVVLFIHGVIHERHHSPTALFVHGRTLV